MVNEARRERSRTEGRKDHKGLGVSPRTEFGLDHALGVPHQLRQTPRNQGAYKAPRWPVISLWSLRPSVQILLVSAVSVSLRFVVQAKTIFFA
jgi:hypothetical protein